MSRAAFLAGVRLAADMLAEQELHRDTTETDTSLLAEFREGAPQANRVVPFLRRLIAEPQMVEGFAAALTDYFAMSVATLSHYYSEATEGEIFGDAGEVQGSEASR